jgi:hypothetical protein
VTQDRVSDAPAQAADAPAAQPARDAPAHVPGAGRPAALASVLRSGAPLSNRAVARLLDGYGYGYADDPLNAGGFGVDDAAVRVRPGPVRATMIGGATGPQQKQAAAEAEAAAAPQPAPAAPETDIRRLIMKEARAAVGATEFGGDGRFEALFGKSGAGNEASTLESARIEAGKKDAVHTTCIDFQTVVWGRARDALQTGKLGKAPKIVTPMNAPTLPGWVEAVPGMPTGQRPKVGDIYVLSKIKPQPPRKPPKDGEAAAAPKLEKGKFSHEGFIDKIDLAGPVVDGEQCEIWWTIDGGQGSKTVYDRSGHLVGARGAEAVLRTGRVYIPSKNLITGEKIQDADMRLLTGWLNVDALVTPGA